MPEERDELRILVPNSMRSEIRRLTRRQALVAGAGTAMAAYLAACGGKTASGGGGGGGGGAKAAATPPTPLQRWAHQLLHDAGEPGADRA